MKKLIRRIGIVMLLFFLCFIGNNKVIHATTIEVTDLDLGDYTAEMTVGTNQLLTITVLPFDVTNQTVTYKSSNTQIATVNAMGRIVAVSKGKTVITVQAGSIKKEFTITVKEEEVMDTIEVTDLDLGDYQKEMIIGTSQLLGITVLPTNATKQKITYKSNNTKIVTVNELGRVTAKKIGKAKITVASGKVSKVISIEVKKQEINEQTTPVTSIEVDEFKEEMKVEETQSITASVLPSDATEATIAYQSSNKGVATISGTGKITALQKGTTTITFTAGGVKKELQLTVTVSTAKIEVNTTYSVLNVGDTIKLGGKVYPDDAVQSLTYKALDEQVISVNSKGIVTAKASGSSSVIISNGD
ncbi:MAG: Ig-like domain-containing protein, partial [bacterium]|nr:Ig-like domain-containing protein [bacterium]